LPSRGSQEQDGRAALSDVSPQCTRLAVHQARYISIDNEGAALLLLKEAAMKAGEVSTRLPPPIEEIDVLWTPRGSVAMETLSR
jgi:hypothetical protein